MFGFDPLTVTVGTLVWLAFRKQSNKFHGVMTPERENIFRSAMEYCKEPSRLRNLSNLFMQHGLKAESYWLSKRADWYDRPEDIRTQHQDIVDRAMKSENIQVILEIADRFEEMTAMVLATKLRKHAYEVQQAMTQKQTEPVTKSEESATTEEKSVVQDKPIEPPPLQVMKGGKSKKKVDEPKPEEVKPDMSGHNEEAKPVEAS